MTTNKQHGGKREGAGRHRVVKDEPTIRVTVRFPQSQYDWLVQQGNVSDVIRQLVQDAMNKDE